MQLTRDTSISDVLGSFPNARRECAWEGGVCYLAERDAKFYIIVDSSTLATFVDPDDEIDLVRVLEFDEQEARSEYLRASSYS